MKDLTSGHFVILVGVFAGFGICVKKLFRMVPIMIFRKKIKTLINDRTMHRCQKMIAQGSVSKEIIVF